MEHVPKHLGALILPAIVLCLKMLIEHRNQCLLFSAVSTFLKGFAQYWREELLRKLHFLVAITITVSSWNGRINCNFEKKSHCSEVFKHEGKQIFFLKILIRGCPTGIHWKEKAVSKQAGWGGIFFVTIYLSIYFIIKEDFHILFVSPQTLRVAFLVASLTICVIGFTHWGPIGRFIVSASWNMNLFKN